MTTEEFFRWESKRRTFKVNRVAKFAVVGNSGSGRSDAIDLVRQGLGMTDCCWLDISDSIDLTSRPCNEVLRDCQTVVAAGGDGTVNAVVNALMQIDRAHRPSLGIIPLGTANDFAGTLGIPDDVPSAIELLTLSPVAVDIVRIAGENFERFFANVAAGGNCVRVSEAMTEEIKQAWGSLSYLRGAVDVLSDLTTYRIELTCQGQRLGPIECWAVLVANGRTNAGRITIAPKASPRDGKLDLIIILDGKAIDMVEIIAKNLSGRFLSSQQIIFRQIDSFSLHSTPAMQFTVDGEVIEQEPVYFEVVPAAIFIHADCGETADSD